MKLPRSITVMCALQFCAIASGSTSDAITSTDDHAAVKRKGNFTYLVSDKFPTAVAQSVRLAARASFLSTLKLIPISQTNDLIDAARMIRTLPVSAITAGITYENDEFNRLYGSAGSLSFSDVIGDEQSRAAQLYNDLEKRGIKNPILAEIAGIQNSDECSGGEK